MDDTSSYEPITQWLSNMVSSSGIIAAAETVIQTEPLVVWIQGILFVICLVLSACFSGSETALTSMSKLRIKRLFGEEEKAYQKLEGWLEDPNRYLATILVGNNFVNILASVTAANLAEIFLVTQFNLDYVIAYSSAVAVGVTTFLLLIFGEIVPKTYSKQHAVRISLLVIGPLDLMYKILKPLIWFFLIISNTFIKLMGGQAVKEVPLLTEEDVRALIEMSEREGLLEVEEREMIHSIIDFGETLVKEIMTPRVDFVALPVDMPLKEIITTVVDCGHSRIPVYRDELEEIVGILYVKDLLGVDTNGNSEFNLESILRPPLFIPKTKKVSDLLQTFKLQKTHIAIVVDEYGLTGGLVTIEDILEEIVGDIQDEYDVEEPGYEVQEDGSIIADAKVDLDILIEVVNIEFPEKDVETLGGFISSVMGTVPKVDESIEYANYKFTILDSDERKINKVKIEPVSREIKPVELPEPEPQNQS